MTSQEKWITIRKQIGTKGFVLYPEIGIVLVGNETFAVNIPNHVLNKDRESNDIKRIEQRF